MTKLLVIFLGLISLTALLSITVLAGLERGIPSEIPTFGLAALTGMTGILVRSPKDSGEEP